MRRVILLLAAALVTLVAASGAALAQTAPEGALDATCEDFAGVGGGGFGFTGDTTVAQTFTAVNSGKLISAQAMRIGKGGGEGNVVIKVVRLSASGAPEDTALASTTVPGTAIPSGESLTITGDFAPADAASVVAGRRYALVLQATGTLVGRWGWMSPDMCNGGAYHGGSLQDGGRQDLPFAAYVLNDNFSDARAIRGSAVSIPGSTATATREGGEPDHLTSGSDASSWVGDHSVWFRWRAPVSGSTTIDTCEASIDSILAVYTGSALDSLARIAENNNACASGWGSKVTFNATAGTTYRIAVGDAGGAREGAFVLKLAAPAPGAPANDAFDVARQVTGGTASVFGTNFGATRQTGEPFFFQDPDTDGFLGGSSVWYRWTAPARGSVRIDTCSSDYDSLLGVYTGGAVNALTQIAANDDGCPSGLGSSVTFRAQAGTTYRILVDGTGAHGARDDGEGTFELALQDLTSPTVTRVSPEDRATNVSAAASISATFSEPIDADTLRDPETLESTAFTLARKTANGKERVAAEVRYNDAKDRATLEPTKDLRPGATYRVTIKDVVRDPAGNPLARERTWTFTVRR